MKKTPVFLCCNDTYSKYMITLLKSLKKFNSELEVHILFDSFSLDIRAEIENLISSDFFVLKWHDISELSNKYLSKLKDCSYLGIAAYFRFLIPYLDLKYNKGLYLDVDIICNGSINNLLNIDLNNKTMGLCFEGPDHSDLNTGVMLMNIDLWRNKGLTIKLIDFILNNPEKIIVADQSAVNCYVNKENIYIMEDKYNVTIQKNGIKFKDIIFFHYNGKYKPNDIYPISYKNPHKYFYKVISFLDLYFYKKVILFINNFLVYLIYILKVYILLIFNYIRKKIKGN